MKNLYIIPKNKLKSYRFDYLRRFLELNLIGNGVFLAGGSVRSFLRKSFEEEISDYDLFFTDLRLVPWVRQKLEAAGAELKFQCPEGKLFTYKFKDKPIEQDVFEKGMKIQLICEQNYNSPVDCINQFDFGATMGAWDGNFLYICPKMIKDIISKRLTLHNLDFPIATLKRIIKYNKKGFNTSKIAQDYVRKLIDLTLRGGNEYWDKEKLRIYID